MTGTPRQADLRRAVSSAYYAVFHFVLTAAADDVVGMSKRGTARYRLVYRSVDHRALRDLCLEAGKAQMPTKLRKYVPDGFGASIQAFAKTLADLQERRHVADYDPSLLLKPLDADLAISMARRAIERFREAKREERQIFLALLLFPAR